MHTLREVQRGWNRERGQGMFCLGTSCVCVCVCLKTHPKSFVLRGGRAVQDTDSHKIELRRDWVEQPPPIRATDQITAKGRRGHVYISAFSSGGLDSIAAEQLSPILRCQLSSASGDSPFWPFLHFLPIWLIVPPYHWLDGGQAVAVHFEPLISRLYRAATVIMIIIIQYSISQDKCVRYLCKNEFINLQETQYDIKDSGLVSRLTWVWKSDS